MSVQKQLPGSLRRHEDLYCDDLIIQVEDTLFKVPARLFKESRVFSDMLSMPQGDATNIDGRSDEQPLNLEQVSVKEFQHLLYFLFPQPSWPDLDVDGWSGVLRLANLWSIDRARTAAITALDKLVISPSQRIHLARSFKIPGWQTTGLMDLVKQTLPVSSSDMDLIGIDTVLKLAGLREKYGPTAVQLVERLGFELQEYDRFTRDINSIQQGYEAVLKSIPSPASAGYGYGTGTRYNSSLYAEATNLIEACSAQNSRRRKELTGLRKSMPSGTITPAVICATFDLEEEGGEV